MLLLIIAIALLSLILILTILFALNYFGLFDTINVSSGQSPYKYGNCSIVYRIDYGKYSDSSSLFTEICSIFPMDFRSKYSTFGIYLERDRLNEIDRRKFINVERYDSCEYIFMIGAIISDDSIIKHPIIKSMLMEKGYRFAQLPEQVDPVVYVKFPYRGIMSVVIGSRRVYSSIESYIQENRLTAYPKIEIYDGDNIHYILPLSKQNDFINLISMKLAEQQKQLSSSSPSPQSSPKESDNEEIIDENKEEEIIGEDSSQESNGERNSDSSYELVD
ncbi:testis-expressed protein 264-like [Dermatophagoides pteronyssinus]|uniref:testis-expressed protein 264-like n=1 Tax=Dermatophagoides pteronyssinus TaxID=6956 RepID=UPI003F6809C2